jgi:hypothetical protein
MGAPSKGGWYLTDAVAWCKYYFGKTVRQVDRIDRLKKTTPETVDNDY